MNNRRGFLKILGTGIAAAASGPLTAGAAKLKTKDRPLKIGILSPRSNIRPQYTYSFSNGLRLGLDQHKAVKKGQIEIINEPNGYGSPFISKQNAQKLMFENHVDIITGILGNEVLGRFDNIFSERQTPFIACNAGEYYPVKQLQNNPFLFFNSLNLYQAAYMTGQYAASSYGKKGLIVTSMYDSGYDATFAFFQGAAASNGTTETLMMNMNENDFSSKVIAHIQNTRPDYVFILLSGDSANNLIISIKNDSDLKIPMLTTSFVTDNSNLPMLGKYADGIESISPWDKNLNIQANREFIKSYLDTYRAEPDLFAMLGYETGLMAYHALAACQGEFSGVNLRKCLSEVRMFSPRGRFSCDSVSGITHAPSYHIQIQTESLTRQPHSILKRELETIDAFHADFAVLDNSLRSGWLNPYLFV